MTELNRNSQLFFDYILPTVMAVGAGVGTYLLTGGEEEYPLEEEIPEEFNSEEIHETSNTPDQAEDVEEIVPEWAKQLREKLETMHLDLQDIKSKINIPSSSPISSKSFPESTEPISSTSPLQLPPTITMTFQDYQKTIHNAVYRFAYNLPDEVDCNVYEYLDTSYKESEEDTKLTKPHQDGIDLLLLFIKNLMKQPTIPRYRRISINNANFKTILQPLVGHHAVLTSIGFVLKGIYYEFEWNLSASENSTSSMNSPSSGKNKDIPSIEFASLLLQQMTDLLSSLKESKRKLLQLIQQHRGFEPSTPSSTVVSTVVATSSSEKEDQPVSPSITTVKNTPFTTISLLSNKNSSPLLLSGTHTGATKLDEIIKKITSKSEDLSSSNNHPSITASIVNGAEVGDHGEREKIEELL